MSSKVFTPVQMSKEINNGMYLMGLLWGLKEITQTKELNTVSVNTQCSLNANYIFE